MSENNSLPLIDQYLCKTTKIKVAPAAFNHVRCTNDRLTAIRDHTPCDLQRMFPSFTRVYFRKSTKLQQLLPYVGPVSWRRALLKDISAS